jgi:hypothetical protein
MYYIMENLYAYLRTEEIAREIARGRGVYLGREFRYPSMPRSVRYNTGGAGYVLDRVAVAGLAAHLDDAACHPYHEQPLEDVYVALCLANMLEVYPFDTRDRRGRQRFHNFPPGLLYQPLEGEGAGAEAGADTGRSSWYSEADPARVHGSLECCSEASVSYHYIGAELMYAVDDFLRRCPASRKEAFYATHGEGYYNESTTVKMLYKF